MLKKPFSRVRRGKLNDKIKSSNFFLILTESVKKILRHRLHNVKQYDRGLRHQLRKENK